SSSAAASAVWTSTDCASHSSSPSGLYLFRSTPRAARTPSVAPASTSAPAPPTPPPTHPPRPPPPPTPAPRPPPPSPPHPPTPAPPRRRTPRAPRLPPRSRPLSGHTACSPTSYPHLRHTRRGGTALPRMPAISSPAAITATTAASHTYGLPATATTRLCTSDPPIAGTPES